MKWQVLIEFFAFLLGAFWLAFGVVGRILSELWKQVLEWLFNSAVRAIGLSGASGIFSGLIVKGLVPVFVTLLGFLPSLIILFSFFYLLEKSGLALKVGKEFSGVFNKLGIDERAIACLMMGFGCTTVAVCATNSITDETSRKRAVLLLPFAPCSAKTPVLLLICNCLGFGFFALFLFYVLSVAIGFFAIFLTRPKKNYFQYSANLTPLIFKKEKFSFNDFVKSVSLNIAQFLKKVSGSVLLAATFLYFLSNFSFSLKVVVRLQDSILYNICSILSPIFAPIGLDNPAVLACLIFSMIGKEMALAALAVFAPPAALFSTSAALGFTTASAISFIVVFILCPPCIPAISAIRAQTNKRTMLTSIFISFLAAYTVGFLVFMSFYLLV